MVKRNILRLVPSMKKALAAARVVRTPAVAAAGNPVGGRLHLLLQVHREVDTVVVQSLVQALLLVE